MNGSMPRGPTPEEKGPTLLRVFSVVVYMVCKFCVNVNDFHLHDINIYIRIRKHLSNSWCCVNVLGHILYIFYNYT